MKNNNEMPVGVATIVILLLLLMGFGYISTEDEPHFKITKEVCEEESEWRMISSCYMGCFFYVDKNVSFSLIDRCKENCNEILIIKTCHNEPVDEILLYNVSNEMILDCWMLDNKDKCMFNSYTNDLLIFKEYLTIEWLDENAECVNSDKRLCILAKFPNGKKKTWIELPKDSTFLELKESCDLNKGKIKYCSKYKIGNYTITIK